MDWLDYRDALGIGFSDYDKVEFFMTKMFNLIDDDSDNTRCQINEDEYFRFCNTTGSKYLQTYPGDGYSKILKILNANSHSLHSFLAYYIAFVNCQEDNQYKHLKRENYKNILCNMLYESHIPYDLKEDEDGYFVFPKGAGELDDALVSQPLEWLKDYPKAYETYCIALRQYADGIYIRDIADNLRKALEDFLREFLENEKDLNSNKKVAEQYLKDANANPQLVNMFGSLLTHYYLLNNDIAKHNNKVDKTYLEFLLYQTGVFIRMLIVVKKEREAHTHAD